MVRRLGVAGVSSPLQWSPGQTVRSIEGRGYMFLGGGHPALSLPPLAYAADDDPPCRATFRARLPPSVALALRFPSVDVARARLKIRWKIQFLVRSLSPFPRFPRRLGERTPDLGTNDSDDDDDDESA